MLVKFEILTFSNQERAADTDSRFPGALEIFDLSRLLTMWVLKKKI